MASSRACVLVIDDEPDARALIALQLSTAGFEVAEAESGQAAAELLGRRKFDLAITDLKMPGMGGASTVAALKEIDPQIEIIVVTGFASVETAVECMKRGAFDYVRKPYEPEKMCSVLERALERARLQGVVALYEASKALLGAHRREDLAKLASSLGHDVLGADGVALILGDPESAHFLHWQEGAQAVAPVELIERLATRARASGASQRFPSPDAPEPLAPDRNGPRSALVYLLSNRESCLGVLVALRGPQRAAFGAAELQRGAVFANQLVVALDNARLFEVLEEQLRELTAHRDQLVQAQKLAIAGRMAGHVAHETNRPLAALELSLPELKSYATSVGGLWFAAKEVARRLLRSEDETELRLARSILEAAGSEEAATEMVEEIAQVIDELVGGTRRIADLAVGFSRLAGLIESERPERFDLQKLIAECLEMASQDETFADMEIAHLGGSDGPLEAEGVRVDLRCSLMTLLSFLARHAKAKSSPSSGKVVVQATLIEGCPSICVQDEGLQLAEKERSRLFDPKLELDAAQSQSIRLDIGLALAFQLVQRSGGALEVGPSPRGGTVFRMRLGSGLASTASMSPKSPTR